MCYTCTTFLFDNLTFHILLQDLELYIKQKRARDAQKLVCTMHPRQFQGLEEGLKEMEIIAEGMYVRRWEQE